MEEIKGPRLRRKPDTPESLHAAVGRAKGRTLKRDTALPLRLERDDEGRLLLNDKGEAIWDWPFDGECPDDWPDWSWMFVDAFGTRNAAVASAFADHLLSLCGTEWDDGAHIWVPNDAEMQLLLAVVRSHRPKNEAQAAQAAQVAATHIIAMRVAKHVAKHPHDTRMVSAYARLITASAQLSDVANAGRGKRTARQSIKVVRETHVHHHQHVHIPGGGDENEIRGRTKGGVQKLSSASSGSAALPGKDTGGDVVPIARRQR